MLGLSLGIDRTRTLRGAASGAIAACLWTLLQPLDKRAFGCRYDDIELLGKAITRGDGWYALGVGLHLQNGAVFGAAYANVAPQLPLAPALRGPAMALTELFATWPLSALSDRHHPARDELPTLRGNRRAFYQAIWRHLLFGVALGELERRLNPEPAPLIVEAVYSSNGHGDIEHAVGAGAGGARERSDG